MSNYTPPDWMFEDFDIEDEEQIYNVIKNEKILSEPISRTTGKYHIAKLALKVGYKLGKESK